MITSPPPPQEARLTEDPYPNSGKMKRYSNTTTPALPVRLIPAPTCVCTNTKIPKETSETQVQREKSTICSKCPTSINTLYRLKSIKEEKNKTEECLLSYLGWARRQTQSLWLQRFCCECIIKTPCTLLFTFG